MHLRKSTCWLAMPLADIVKKVFPHSLGWFLSYGYAICPLQTGRSAKTRIAEQIGNTYVKFADRREPRPVFGLLHCLSGMMTGFMMLSLISTSAYQV